MSARLVLASASPRRAEILRTLGLEFEVRPSAVSERVEPGEAPSALARRLAKDKAKDVASTIGARGGEGERFVLGADTVVVVDGEILGKPDDDADATRMIARLAGRWHEVITGVALAREGGDPLEDLAVVTRVCFVPMDAARIARYVATGEGSDKAGAYAVQAIGAGLVSRIEGSYSNVVGLPAAETVALLERHGASESWP